MHLDPAISGAGPIPTCSDIDALSALVQPVRRPPVETDHSLVLYQKESLISNGLTTELLSIFNADVCR